MRSKDKELKVKREEKENVKLEAKKPKKEFKIEIVKVGKLDEKTAEVSCGCGCS